MRTGHVSGRNCSRTHSTASLTFIAYIVFRTILVHPILSLISPHVASSPVGFSHAKVQRSSGVKHHCANGSRICPAAFRKSKMAFQPPPRTSADWVFREIPRPFACLSVLSPAVWLACKISPGKESRKASEGREKKKIT